MSHICVFDFTSHSAYLRPIFFFCKLAIKSNSSSNKVSGDAGKKNHTKKGVCFARSLVFWESTLINGFQMIFLGRCGMCQTGQICKGNLPKTHPRVLQRLAGPNPP